MRGLRRQVGVDVGAFVDPESIEAITWLDKTFRRFIDSIEHGSRSIQKSEGFFDDFFRTLMVWNVSEILEKVDRMRYDLDQTAKGAFEVYKRTEEALVGLTAIYKESGKEFGGYLAQMRSLAGRWSMTYEDAIRMIEDFSTFGKEGVRLLSDDLVVALAKVYNVSESTIKEFYLFGKTLGQTKEQLSGVISTAMNFVGAGMVTKEFVGTVMEASAEIGKLLKRFEYLPHQITAIQKEMVKAAVVMYKVFKDTKISIDAVVSSIKGVTDFREELMEFSLGLGGFPVEKIKYLAFAFGDAQRGIEIMTETRPLVLFEKLLDFRKHLEGNTIGMEQFYFALKKAFPEMSEMIWAIVYNYDNVVKALEELNKVGDKNIITYEDIQKAITGTLEAHETRVELARQERALITAIIYGVREYKKILGELARQQYENIKSIDKMVKSFGKFGDVFKDIMRRVTAFKEYGIRGLLAPFGTVGITISNLIEILQQSLVPLFVFMGLGRMTGWLGIPRLVRFIRGGGVIRQGGRGIRGESGWSDLLLTTAFFASPALRGMKKLIKSQGDLSASYFKQADAILKVAMASEKLYGEKDPMVGALLDMAASVEKSGFEAKRTAEFYNKLSKAIKAAGLGGSVFGKTLGMLFSPKGLLIGGLAAIVGGTIYTIVKRARDLRQVQKDLESFGYGKKWALPQITVGTQIVKKQVLPKETEKDLKRFTEEVATVAVSPGLDARIAELISGVIKKEYEKLRSPYTEPSAIREIPSQVNLKAIHDQPSQVDVKAAELIKNLSKFLQEQFAPAFVRGETMPVVPEALQKEYGEEFFQNLWKKLGELAMTETRNVVLKFFDYYKEKLYLGIEGYIEKIAIVPEESMPKLIIDVAKDLIGTAIQEKQDIGKGFTNVVLGMLGYLGETVSNQLKKQIKDFVSKKAGKGLLQTGIIMLPETGRQPGVLLDTDTDRLFDDLDKQIERWFKEIQFPELPDTMKQELGIPKIKKEIFPVRESPKSMVVPEEKEKTKTEIGLKSDDLKLDEILESLNSIQNNMIKVGDKICDAIDENKVTLVVNGSELVKAFELKYGRWKIANTPRGM